MQQHQWTTSTSRFVGPLDRDSQTTEPLCDDGVRRPVRRERRGKRSGTPTAPSTLYDSARAVFGGEFVTESDSIGPTSIKFLAAMTYRCRRALLRSTS